MTRVLVILPAYNEAETIASVIAGISREAPDFDVVVIDDGSRDATSEIVMSCSRARLVRLPCNLGIGGAMQTGYKFALRNGYDIAVQCDSDGQHPVERIRDLVARVDDGTADMIIGSRYVAKSNYSPSFFRRLGKSILSRLVDAIVGSGITDTTSGFRAMNRKVLSIFANNYPDDYPEPEALVILHKSGLKVAELPVEMLSRQGGQTSIRPPHAAYYMIKVGLAIVLDMFRKFSRNYGDR